MTFMDTVAESLHSGAESLRGRSDSPRLDAEILLCKALATTRTALIVRGAQIVPASSLHTYRALIERRAQGAPIAYLTGSREFWSLDLSVTPDVLVPRPETERLVELALELLPAGEPYGEPRAVLDLGTGSGAIALSIASERPQVEVTGVDVSAAALAVAAANARKLQIARVRWILGDWFDAVPGGRFDVIVANPPYVAAGDPALAALGAEPLAALTPGPTGLEALARIAGGAARHLRPGGWLLVEHGSVQAAEVAAMLERGGLRNVSSHADHAGRPRVTRGCFIPHFRENS